MDVQVSWYSVRDQVKPHKLDEGRKCMVNMCKATINNPRRNQHSFWFKKRGVNTKPGSLEVQSVVIELLVPNLMEKDIRALKQFGYKVYPVNRKKIPRRTRRENYQRVIV